MKEEAKQEQSEAEARMSQQRSQLGDNDGHASQTNVIGNIEDPPSAFTAQLISNA